MRYLNSNIESYTQMIEFLDEYSGPTFRSSKEKFRLAFSVVPSNLHVHQFTSGNEVSTYYTTCGACMAGPLRFRHGGISKIRETLSAALEPTSQNHTVDQLFFARRRTLDAASAQIETLSQRINTQWHISAVGTVDAFGLQLLSELKQVCAF